MTCFKIPAPIKGLLMAAALGLTGCGPIIDTGVGKVPDNIYDLEPAVAASRDNEDAKTVFFEKVTYPAYIDSMRIAVRPGGQEIQYLAGARWSDNAPGMIGRFLTISLDSSEGLIVIDRDHPALDHDYKLVVDVRDFSAHVSPGGTPEVVVSVNADLMKASPLGVVARKTFTRSVSAGVDSRDAIVAAFQQAMEGIASDMEGWIETASQ